MEPNLRNYAILLIIVFTSVYFGNQLRKANDMLEHKEDQELIQKYLLNETKITEMTKAATATEVAKATRPKLWIHIKYDKNSRKWLSFGSRSSNNLNQPYLHLTIKSIIQHCGNDFHICFVDDDSFSKLLPEWQFKMSHLAEPFLSRVREYGMAKLLYKYGGMILPNSFICFRNLITFYKKALVGNKPFVTEQVNHHAQIHHGDKRLLFVPDSYIMGSNMGDSTIRMWIELLEKQIGPHFHNQTEFLGVSNQWFLDRINDGSMTLIDGAFVGVKTAQRRAILLDDLMETESLDLDPMCYGVYVPADELLKRNKYEWYAVLSTEELMKSKPILTRYLVQSLYTTFTNDNGGANLELMESPKYIIPSQIGGGGI